MDKDDKKQDLTGILDLQKLQAEDPTASIQNETQDPFAVNELAPIEQVEEFQSIDQIGMMDHAPPPADEDPFAITPPEEPSTEFSLDPPSDPIAAPEIETPADGVTVSSLEEIKNYSEQSQIRSSSEIKIHYPFHLKINGAIGPFERDKLLLFITENPIGLSSADLDLQIQSGKIFFPRISEYAAIKLIQEMRDSGLSFQIHPSDREPSELTSYSPSLSFHYQNAQRQTEEQTLIEIPVLNAQGLSELHKSVERMEEVSTVQYVKTEVLEVEDSPMIQELIERMTETLKQKARLKGGNALLELKKEITPLRMPSQYQISLRADVVRLADR